MNPARTSLSLALPLSLVALILPLNAAAESPAAKVEARLAARAAASPAGADLHVLVSGSNPAAAITRVGGTVEGNLDLVGTVAATVDAENLLPLAADDNVGFVSADVVVSPLGANDDDDDRRLATLYPRVDGATAAWARKLTGKGVGVALIDSGVTDLKDFKKRLVRVKLGDLPSGDDSYGHGTLVAGIIGGDAPKGDYVGIAPGVTLYSIDVNRSDGVRSSDVIAGLQWVFENAHRHNIRVVNLSLTETVESSYQESVLDLAVERLWAAGIVVVVAAGNSGPGAADFAPANDPLVLTVGASDTNATRTTADDSLASFTTLGLTRDGFAKPELLAPGRLIASTLPADSALGQQAPAANRAGKGYATISGTSFAAPQVAGAAAILLQQHPDWSPDNVKWALRETARVVVGSPVGALSLSPALALSGAPGRANQGVPALVCAPGALCIVGGTVGTVSSSWNSSSWNSSSWNSSSWNSSSWNSSSWNSSSWNSSSWNSSSWNSSSWNSSSWNSSSWNAYLWS